MAHRGGVNGGIIALGSHRGSASSSRSCASIIARRKWRKWRNAAAHRRGVGIGGGS